MFLLMIFFQKTHEVALLSGMLEATMAKLGGGVDELDGDLLQSLSAGLHKQ